MRNPGRIEEGDIVKVDFETLSTIYGAEVLHVPVATGDSWIVRGGISSEGALIYIQSFCRMTLLEKGKEP